MSDIAKREADRLRALLAIYEQTEDNTQKFVSLWDIREALGLADDEMANAVDYLESRGLIRPLRTMAGQRTPIHTQITHAGVRQMERTQTATRPTDSAVINMPAAIDATDVPAAEIAITKTPKNTHITASGVRAVEQAKHTPDERTEGFAPYGTVVMHVHENKTVIKKIKNSAVVAGSDKVKQKAKIKVAEIDPHTRAGVEDFLRQYHAKLPELEQEQTPKAVEVIAKKVDELQNQIDLPRGKKSKLKKATESLREILEVGVGGVVTTGLLLALNGIPW